MVSRRGWICGISAFVIVATAASIELAMGRVTWCRCGYIKLCRRLPPGIRFVIAVFLESAWEVLENTPLVINRYRAATISLDYYGDSVINSVSDIGAMMVGFWIARKSFVWITLGLVIVTEVMLLLIIRDNLTLNILMLFHPFEAIRRWQLGG